MMNIMAKSYHHHHHQQVQQAPAVNFSCLPARLLLGDCSCLVTLPGASGSPNLSLIGKGAVTNEPDVSCNHRILQQISCCHALVYISIVPTQNRASITECRESSGILRAAVYKLQLSESCRAVKELLTEM